MKIEKVPLGNVTFEERVAENGDKPLLVLTFYAGCPQSCSGCLAPYLTKMQTIATLGLRKVMVCEYEGKQNREAVKCPYFVAQDYI